MAVNKMRWHTSEENVYADENGSRCPSTPAPADPNTAMEQLPTTPLTLRSPKRQTDHNIEEQVSPRVYRRLAPFIRRSLLQASTAVLLKVY